MSALHDSNEEPGSSARPIPRVVLAHDYLLVMRGAERSFAAIADLYPGAPVLTLLYDEEGTSGRFQGHQISTSPLQRLGLSQESFRRLLPLYPWAVGRLASPPCEVLLSSSSAFAHGVRAPQGAVHVCYCYTPFRYAWYEQERAINELPPPLRPLLKRELGRIRRWDLQASRRVDSYIAISELSRERIGRYFGREAKVIHPPVETERFAPGEPSERLLLVSELVRHKRIEVALEAARQARTPIAIVGSGPHQAALEQAYPEAEFLGRADDAELAKLYASSLALLMPSVEEFGIVAVEAQAAGRPVIAAAAGGALETVIDGRTGRLAEVDDPADFARAIKSLDSLDFDSAAAVENAGRFSVATFKQRISDHVLDVVSRHGGRLSAASSPSRPGGS